MQPFFAFPALIRMVGESIQLVRDTDWLVDTPQYALVRRVVAVVPGYPSEFKTETTFKSVAAEKLHSGSLLGPLRRRKPKIQKLQWGLNTKH